MLEVRHEDGKPYPPSTFAVGFDIPHINWRILRYLTLQLHSWVIGPEQTVCLCLKVSTTRRVVLHSH